jgi:hypothetical protein
MKNIIEEILEELTDEFNLSDKGVKLLRSSL